MRIHADPDPQPFQQATPELLENCIPQCWLLMLCWMLSSVWSGTAPSLAHQRQLRTHLGKSSEYACSVVDPKSFFFNFKKIITLQELFSRLSL